MKKILYVVSTLKRSGPTNQLFNVINNLDRTTFEPIIITLSPEPTDSRWMDYEALGINLQSLNLSRLGGALLAKSKLIKLVQTIQPDLIHTQGIRADILLTKLSKSTAHVSTIHNFPQLDYTMTYGKLLGKLMLKKHIISMKKIDRLIGCSLSVSNNLIDNFNLKNTVAIQNGVDQEQFYFNKENSKYIKSKLGLSANAVVWISTGHLSILKDPIFLILQWCKLIKTYENHHLVLLGSGELHDECIKLSTDSSNIHLVGRVNNVRDYLQGANYFVSASKSEGLPMATIEAMACGLPVLLSDIEPHKEIHDMSPSVGELFTLGDEESFIESFKLLANSNYDEHQTAALNLIDNNLSASQMSQKYQNIYHELIGA